MASNGRWTCLICNTVNIAKASNCAQCKTDKQQALLGVVLNPKTVCQGCGHRHRAKYACHVYVQVYNDALPEDEESEELLSTARSKNRSRRATSTGHDSDSDGSLGSYAETASRSTATTSKVSTATNPPLEFLDPIVTPTWASWCGLERCNCIRGMPPNDMRYIDLPTPMVVDNIQILEAPDYQQFNPEHATPADPAIATYLSSDEVYHILKYLDLWTVGRFSRVSTTWREAASFVPEYASLNALKATAIIKPHDYAVQNLVARSNVLFSAGDKRVQATNLRTMSKWATITTETSTIDVLTTYEHSLFAGAGHGAIREFPITHNPAKMTQGKVLWEHHGRVVAMMCERPSRFPCATHRAIGHVCVMYTCSEDRTIKVWDTITWECIKTIRPSRIRMDILTTMTHSERHLFAGSLRSGIFVITKLNFCEREDVHMCHMPGASACYCTQTTILLDNTEEQREVTALHCAGANGEYTHLYAGDLSGQVIIWWLPERGLQYSVEDWRMAHPGGTKVITSTPHHLITAGADSHVRIWEFNTHIVLRSLDLMSCKLLTTSPHVPRKITCVSFKLGDDDRAMFVGTNYGDVFIYQVGPDI